MAGQPPFAVHISLTVNPESVYWDLAERLLVGLKIARSRVKEWLSDRREGLSVAAGFPMAVPHSPSHSRFTIPFPSHRTFSFPEYGGPTVFIAHHAQVSPGTRSCRYRCRRAPSCRACCSESVSIRTPGLYFSGSSTCENGC